MVARTFEIGTDTLIGAGGLPNRLFLLQEHEQNFNWKQHLLVTSPTLCS